MKTYKNPARNRLLGLISVLIQGDTHDRWSVLGLDPHVWVASDVTWVHGFGSDRAVVSGEHTDLRRTRAMAQLPAEKPSTPKIRSYQGRDQSARVCRTLDPTPVTRPSYIYS